MISKTPVRLWTRGELAELFQVNVSTVDRWIAAGELDSVVIGRTRRIPDPAVQDWLARRLHPALDNLRKPGRKPSRKPAA
jgi:excisionase family DNA binding protein